MVITEAAAVLQAEEVYHAYFSVHKLRVFFFYYFSTCNARYCDNKSKWC